MKGKGMKVFGIVLVTLLASSCIREEPVSVRSVEQAYREEGIPVRTRQLSYEEFSTFSRYTARVEGETESRGSASVASTVEEVLFSVGDYVEKGEVIVRLPRDTPSANFFQSQAAYTAAKDAFERVEKLYESKGISRQSYDEAKTLFEVQNANLNMVNELLEVEAPVSGYLTELTARSGMNVYPGSPLFTVSEYSRLRAVVSVGSDVIGSIREGSRAVVSWQGNRLSGSVEQVALSMSQQRNAFEVTLVFDNRDLMIPPGVNGEIFIEHEYTEQALVLKRSELLKDVNGWYLYVNEDGYARRRDVEVASRQGLSYRITEGLKPGESIITEGVQLLKENALLNVLGNDPAETETRESLFTATDALLLSPAL